MKELVASKEKQSLLTKPFIRWAGGKQNLINEIFKFIPKERTARYFEPFLGGGSFFLKGEFGTSFLSDLNPNLTNSYQQVKDNPTEVFQRLQSFQFPITPELYYKVRDEYNSCSGEQTLEQAVRFIFLNRTSFNGIYRVNRLGHYNVPFGKADPAFGSLENLKAIGEKLSKATITTGYYDEIEDVVQVNDLVYLDPPYPRLSETAFFNLYTLDRFSDDEQEDVSKFANRLDAKGAKVIVSNADLPIIRDYYAGWDIQECSAYRYISCKKERIKVKELIIRNFTDERA